VIDVHEITKGDTHKSLVAELIAENLSENEVPVDLTGCSVAFRMVSDAGVVKVNDAAATIDDVDAGQVSYAFSDADVDTAGTFWGWFIVTSSDKTDTYPRGGRRFKILITDAA